MNGELLLGRVQIERPPSALAVRSLSCCCSWAAAVRRQQMHGHGSWSATLDHLVFNQPQKPFVSCLSCLGVTGLVLCPHEPEAPRFDVAAGLMSMMMTYGRFQPDDEGGEHGGAATVTAPR
jgi:hypothetical protein